MALSPAGRQLEHLLTLHELGWQWGSQLPGGGVPWPRGSCVQISGGGWLPSLRDSASQLSDHLILPGSSLSLQALELSAPPLPGLG